MIQSPPLKGENNISERDAEKDVYDVVCVY
jgi:hypothetical protein